MSKRSTISVKPNVEEVVDWALEFFTTVEAASILKVSKRTLEKWRKSGGGPRYAKLGSRVTYPGKCLREWIDSHTHRNTSE